MIGRSSNVFLYVFVCENARCKIVHRIVFAQTEEKMANLNDALRICGSSHGRDEFCDCILISEIRT